MFIGMTNGLGQMMGGWGLEGQLGELRRRQMGVRCWGGCACGERRDGLVVDGHHHCTPWGRPCLSGEEESSCRCLVRLAKL